MKPMIFLAALLSFFTASCQTITISGRVLNEDREPVAGAIVLIKGSNKSVATDKNGLFTIHGSQLTDTLLITATGYELTEEINNVRGLLTITLRRKYSLLNQAIVIAYGKTTRRLNTGSVGKITSADISRQPVSNPLAALQGRVPGLIINQRNGLPGSGFSILLRGRNSIQQGTDPLFIIDGIPFYSGSLAQRSGSLNANNPFNSINPADIESIEVLKDAGATAIYGSRGANGVVLITTKKGMTGKTQTAFNIYRAWNTPARTIPLMNTQQYLHMRREAFANDNITPVLSNAPELLAWDTARYTNWKKLLIGRTARTTSLQLRISGGNAFTSFSLSSGYYYETTVFPGNSDARRYTANFNVSHASAGNRFSITAATSYSNDKSTLPQQDLSQFIKLYPNAPALYDSAGKLNWSENGAAFSNPFAITLQQYEGITDRLTMNSTIAYRLSSAFTLKTSLGYNYLQFSEISTTPISSQNPASNPKGSASFGNNFLKSLIIEPQAEFSQKTGIGNFLVLTGAAFQREENNSNIISGTGYTNDALLKSVAGAAALTASNNYALYKYAALFGRINYNLRNRYLADLNVRRDGSSRFGPGRQFANFWSLAAAWVFSDEEFLKSVLPFLSYGKLRTSYGITGNDQVGNYQYLDSWTNTAFPFQGNPSLRPARLYNKDYSWEQNRKFEAAIELGFFSNRLLAVINWFRNRSDNQLISYTLPSQTGFTSIIRNFPGVVQNTGIEIEMTTEPVSNQDFKWQSVFNFTKASNRLVSFPGLETSSYASSFSIGEPLNIRKGYLYTGIDPATGIYSFADLNKDSILNTSDYIVTGTTDPGFYGGWQNTLTWKTWQFDFFFQFVKQKGRHAVYANSAPPGGSPNQPLWLLNRWQQPGDIARFQKYTTITSSPAGKASSLMSQSSSALTDASFVRLKNISLSYDLPKQWMQKLKLHSCRMYVQAQNLLTFTAYKGADPENQSLVSLPPLRTIAAGFSLTF